MQLTVAQKGNWTQHANKPLRQDATCKETVTVLNTTCKQTVMAGQAWTQHTNKPLWLDTTCKQTVRKYLCNWAQHANKPLRIRSAALYKTRDLLFKRHSSSLANTGSQSQERRGVKFVHVLTMARVDFRFTPCCIYCCLLGNWKQ